MFELAFTQNVQVMQEQFFDNLVFMGVAVVTMMKGSQVVHYVYNRTRRFWQANDAQPPTPESTTTEEQRSTRRALGFEEIAFTPSTPQQQVPIQQQGPVTRQVVRLEVGQQFLPVDDNDDHDHNDNHDDHDRKKADSSAVAALDRVQQGKRPLGKTIGDIWWDNSSDPWQTEKQQLIQMVEQLQNQVSKLEANINKVNTTTMDNVQTQMAKSTVTLVIPVKDKYAEVINFNDIRKAKDTDEIVAIVDGIIRRPKRSPCTDSSGECGSGNGGTLGIYRVSNGDGDRDGDGGDEFGDNGNYNYSGTIGRSCNNGNRKADFVLVKSSNSTITTFSGSNLSSNLYLPFYKAVKRLIYDQGEDGELPLEILTQIAICGGETFTDAQYKELIRQ